MAEFLLIRSEAPLQAWGDVALDPVRPTRAFPSRSALAGLLANALGWTYRDGERTTTLQDAIRYAVREDRPPSSLDDFQTADLGRIGREGWTRWGVERRGGAFSDGTHILRKSYLADASFLVALRLDGNVRVALDELEAALQRPARPLFLGRKSCPPSLPLAAGRLEAASGFSALGKVPLGEAYRDALRRASRVTVRVWYSPGDGPEHEPVREIEVWDRRDFVTQRFAGSRRVVQSEISVDELTSTQEEA